MQPAYLPWLGYFERVATSDLHIILDDVQIEHGGKTSFTNRNKLRTGTGWMWLTVPIRTKGQRQPMITEVRIDNGGNWRDKHWRSISQQYARAPYFPAYRTELQALYAREWPMLTPLLLHTTAWLRTQLGVTTPCVRSSELGVKGAKSDLILSLCREVGATTYLSGPFGRNYLDMAAFRHAGVEVVFHTYQHPSYTQLHGDFQPHMSALDLLLNHGPTSLEMLLTGTQPQNVDARTGHA
jgi:hypothetical protein